MRVPKHLVSARAGHDLEDGHLRQRTVPQGPARAIRPLARPGV